MSSITQSKMLDITLFQFAFIPFLWYNKLNNWYDFMIGRLIRF